MTRYLFLAAFLALACGSEPEGAAPGSIPDNLGGVCAPADPFHCAPMVKKLEGTAAELETITCADLSAEAPRCTFRCNLEGKAFPDIGLEKLCTSMGGECSPADGGKFEGSIWCR